MEVQVSGKDREILRELGKRIAEIAALPIQKERAKLWEAHDGVRMTRPLVVVFQEPWHELDVDGELTLRTEGDFCRGIENHLRQTLYKWNHMQGDMTVDGVLYSPYAIEDTDFGISEVVDIARTDEASDVYSRHFHIQIKDESDIDKIQMPRIRHDEEATEANWRAMREIFDGVLPVEKRGVTGFWFAPWDEIVRWTGVEEILTDLALRPEYVHKIIGRLVDAWLERLAQYERLRLLADHPSKLWGHGAAQIFSEVSPAMHEEFAIRHEIRWFKHWGKNYYGCCEPLHRKVDICKTIPNLRKISMSPWINFDEAIENVGRDLVFCWKPNPAVLAMEGWHPDAVRKDLDEKLRKAVARGCVVEVVMKDISTVRYQPQRLWEWAKIASQVAGQFA
jgi:hypothetical protein